MGKCHSMNENRQLKLNPNDENQRIYLNCKAFHEKLSNYIKNLELKEKKSREKAKELLRKKQRDRAKFYLKQCKLYREQARIAEGKLDMIENQIINIENTYNTKECLNALQKGNEVLTKVQKEINIEELEKVKDDLEDLKLKEQELGDYFKERGIKNEAECEEELNKLSKEIQKDENNTKVNLNLPNVPINNLNYNINQKQIIQNNNVINNNNMNNNAINNMNKVAVKI